MSAHKICSFLKRNFTYAFHKSYLILCVYFEALCYLSCRAIQCLKTSNVMIAFTKWFSSNKIELAQFFRNSVDGNFISLGHWWFCFAVLIDKTIRRLQNLENHLAQCSMSRMGSRHYLLRLKGLLSCYTAAQLSVKIVLGYSKQWRLFWSEVTI